MNEIIDTYISIAADVVGVEPSAVFSRCNRFDLVTARRLVAYLCKVYGIPASCLALHTGYSRVSICKLQGASLLDTTKVFETLKAKALRKCKDSCKQ